MRTSRGTILLAAPRRQQGTDVKTDFRRAAPAVAIRHVESAESVRNNKTTMATVKVPAS
jgi:hypothetical protein